MPDSTTQHNTQIVNWSQKLRLLLKSRISVLSQKGKGELAGSVRTRTKKNYGDIERIDYIFSRHGVFFQHGAGRGYKVQNGKVIRDPSGESKVMTVMREPKDWLKPVDDNIAELADMVASYQADQAVEVIVKT